MLPFNVSLAFYFKSKGSNLENSKTIGYKGGYIVLSEASVKLYNYFSTNSNKLGHL
jgi:hypothetical protein